MHDTKHAKSVHTLHRLGQVMVTGVNAAGDLTLPAQVAYRYRQLFGPEDDVEMEISSTESANGMTQ